MNIIDAVREALLTNRYISNSNVPEVKVQPKMYEPGIIMRIDGSYPMIGWNVTGEELLSNDWEVVD